MTSQIEPEWDDVTRGQIEALARYLAEVCECGFHRSVIDNWGNRHFTFEERFCPACAAFARYARVVAERDEKATPRDADGQPSWSGPRDQRPDDGRHIYVREMSPAEVQERVSSPRPRPRGPGAAPGMPPG